MTEERTIEVICPCCESTLTVDVELGTVLGHESPRKEPSVTDLKKAVESLQEEAGKREARFKHLMEAEKGKGKVLDRKFQDKLKKAKEEPITPPPLRDIDLD